MSNKFRTSDQFLESVIENANVWIDVLDQRENVLIWNKAAEVMSGYSVDEVMGHGRVWDWLYPEEDYRKQITDQVANLMKRGKAEIDVETKITCKDGKVRIISWNERSLLDQNGKVIGCIAIGRDITKRKHAEETGTRLAAIVESSDDAIIGKTLDGIITNWNKGAEKTYGYSADEAIGKSVSLLFPPGRQDELKEILERVRRGEPAQHYESDRVRKDGGVISISLSVSPIRDSANKIIGASTIARDITQRKNAEQALRKSEQRFRQAMEATSDGLWDWDVETGKIYFSPAYDRILGYEPGELKNNIQTWKDLMHPDDRDRAIRVNEECINNRIANFEVEYRMRAKGGEWKWILGRGKATARSADGRALRMIGTHQDISERKQMEEALVASEAKYRQLVENIDELIYAGQLGANAMATPITFMSDHVERILGYRAKEFLDDPSIWSKSLHPDDVAEVQAATQMVIEGKSAVRVYRMKKRNSEEYCWLEDHVVPQADSTGRVTGYLGVARDITERKQMEQELKNHSENLEAKVEERTTELRLTKERLNYLITSNPAVIYSGRPLADLSDWQVTFLSDRVTQMLGYGPEQFIDHPHFWRTRVHPEDLGAAMEATKSIWKEGHCVSEFRFLHRDGEYRWIREEAKVARDKDGKPIEVNGCWTDITEKKRVELENEELNAELTMRLSDVTDRLESLAKSREKLKVSPDVATGLDIILETVLWDFDLDFGAVLILDRQTNRMNVRASKGKTKEIRLNESYPLQGFVELKDLQAKSITRVLEDGERSILGTAIVHAIPILAGNEIYGLLAFGSQEQNSLRESSMRILESYAELVYSFMIERSMAVTPILESKIEQHVSNLEPGEMYMAKKNPAKAFDVFAGMVFSGHEGLCITRMYPPKVRTKYGLEKTPIVWLTSEASEGEKSVHSIQDLSIMIANYLEKAEKAVVLLDGFEYLITNHGFESFLKFIQILKDRLQGRNAVLIAPVFEQALAPKELALVEREMQALTEQ